MYKRQGLALAQGPRGGDLDQLVGELLDPLLDPGLATVSYTHLRAHETVLDLVCRLLLEKKNTRHTFCVSPVASCTTALSTTTLQSPSTTICLLTPITRSQTTY